MGGTIRVRVRQGLLEPVEKLDLPEGKEVTITILDAQPEGVEEAFRRSFGGWKGTIDAEGLIQRIRESREVSTRPEPRL